MHDLVKSYEVMVKMYPTRVRLDAVYQKRVDWRKNGPKPRKEIDA